MTQGIFRKLFPGKFHEYLPMKKYIFQKRVMTQRLFRKLFPISGLVHYPNLRNLKFHLKFLILEKVSGKSPESLPEFFDPVSFEVKDLFQVR